MMTVAQTIDLIGALAPWALAEPWDNVGLLCGHPGWPVERILVALDVTDAAIDRAEAIGAGLLVTHHPVLFGGTKTLREDDPDLALVARLVRSKIALIAAHTNYDNAPTGVNDALAEALGVSDIQPLEHGLRIGAYEGTGKGLADHARLALGDVVRVYGDPERPIRRVAVCGGAGGEFWPIAHGAGADVYLTGEIKYHDALPAVASGLTILEAGHRATERVAMNALKRDLQKRIHEIQYNVMVFVEGEENSVRSMPDGGPPGSGI